jgi:GH43 family beta-xylosidase
MFTLLFALPVYSIAASAPPRGQVLYVSGTGNDTNTGESASSPLKSLEAAYAKNGGGGTIVLCGSITVSSSFPSSEKVTTITSKYGNQDYTASAKLTLGDKVYINGDTVFENIVISQTSGSCYISCKGHNVTFGNGITNEKPSGNYPVIIGGTYVNDGATAEQVSFYDYTITVSSGSWLNLLGSNIRDNTNRALGTTGGVNIVINGGSFFATGSANQETWVLGVGSFASQKGDYRLEINGGTILSSIFGVSRPGNAATIARYEGDVEIIINGGTFRGKAVDAVQTLDDNYINGNYSLAISGSASFSGITSLSAAAVRGDADYAVPENLTRLLSGFGKTVYLSEEGADTNSGATSQTAVKTIEKAISLLSSDGGILNISGSYAITNLTLPKYTKTLFIKGAIDAELNISGKLTLGGKTSFEGLALNGGGSIIGSGDDIYIGSRVTGSGLSIDGGNGDSHTLEIAGGSFANVTAGSSDGSVITKVSGGTITNLVGTSGNSGNATIMIAGGTVGNIAATANEVSSASVSVYGGKIMGAIAPVSGSGKITGEFGLLLFGGEVSSVSAASGAGKSYTIDKINAGSAQNGYTDIGSSVVFVGDNQGQFTPPLTALSDISTQLPNGGSVVVCGEVNITSEITLGIDKAITVTSLFAGTDYRAATGAELVLGSYLNLAGDTTFENINIVSEKSDSAIYCGFNRCILGEGISCSTDFYGGILTYPSIYGGYRITDANADKVTGEVKTLVIKSGEWNIVRNGNHRITGGNATMKTTTGNATLEISGGIYNGGIFGTGMNSHTGDVTINISGGIIDSTIYAISGADTSRTTAAQVAGTISINISGGEFRGGIIPAQFQDKATISGRYNLAISGGNFDRVGDIKGTDGYLGVNAGAIDIINVDIKKQIEGKVSFTDPIAPSADPTVLYKDGWYYFVNQVSIGGKPALTIARAVNLPDIAKAPATVVWTADDSTPNLVTIWASQLNYFDGKWYIHATCEDKSIPNTNGSAPRIPYVWIAKTDDPMKGFDCYGVMDNIDPEVYMFLSPRFIEHNGKRYMVCGGFYRDTDYVAGRKHYQSLIIGELSSPTSFVDGGKMYQISKPDQKWEYNNSVFIQEGPFAVYAPNGTLFLFYSANETATDAYCTGLLVFTGGADGDVTNMEQWSKYADPFQIYKYGENIFSPGAMVVTSAPDGSPLALYHAKPWSVVTFSYRQLFVQPFEWVNNVPVISAPPTADTVIEITANTKPIYDRISGFKTITSGGDPITDEPAETTPPADTGDTSEIPTPSSNSWLYIAGGILGAAIIAGVAVFVVKRKR